MKQKLNERYVSYFDEAYKIDYKQRKEVDSKDLILDGVTITNGSPDKITFIHKDHDTPPNDYWIYGTKDAEYTSTIYVQNVKTGKPMSSTGLKVSDIISKKELEDKIKYMLS